MPSFPFVSSEVEKSGRVLRGNFSTSLKTNGLAQSSMMRLCVRVSRIVRYTKSETPIIAVTYQ